MAPYTAPPWAASVAPSWHRSLHQHGVDPRSSERPRILTFDELKDHRGPIEELVGVAEAEIGQLYRVASKLGYAVLLASTNGTVVDYRGNPAEADQFSFWGISLGAVWSEEVEGTNGIGTCIAEERPVTIHRVQHFRARHAGLSCSAAAIFDPQARLAAVLDVTSINPEISDRAHAMALAVTAETALAVEERFFRHCFRRAWILAMLPPDGTGPALLLAVDKDHRIIGADRNARSTLALSDGRLAAGVELWTIFRKSTALLRRRTDYDFVAELTHAASNEPWHVLVTTPLVASRHGGYAALHGRPRVASLARSQGHSHPTAHRGGLPAGALRRVQAYIRSHLDQKISLRTLADLAGFSVFHFAREFKNSVGVAPHLYILQARIEQAQKALSSTDAPITEIAGTLGFSDSSRFANQFRRMVGTTPSAFRRARR